jgi:hypothetical protein
MTQVRTKVAHLYVIISFLVILGLIVVIEAQYMSRQELESKLDRDCHGVVAKLDLSEWVEVCRER